MIMSGGAVIGRRNILDLLDLRVSRALDGEKVIHLSAFDADAVAMGRLWHTSANGGETNDSFQPLEPILVA